MAAAHPIPGLLDIGEQLVFEDGTMNPLWRTFFVQLLAALNDLNTGKTRFTFSNFANDAAAEAGGVGVEQQYRNGSIVQVRVT